MIQVEKLTKMYGPTRALDGVSFDVPRGEIVGFLGPNGAGKTTCMKILTGFISPTDGTARIAGHDVVEESLQARSRVGYLPEDTPLYLDMDPVSYLRFVAALREIPASEQELRIRETAEVCGLREVAGRQIGTLSKGYRQRVGLAQALLHTPDILIMDEPTDGLDPNQVVEIRALIRDIGKDRTVMLSTHHLAEVQAVCDRVLIIHEGRVVLDSPVADLGQHVAGAAQIRLEVAAPGNSVSEATFLEAFGGVPNVANVRAVEVEDGAGAEGKVFGLEINVDDGKDVRKELFQVAVDRRWVLLELHRNRLNLEDIFRRVTTVSEA